MLPATRIASRSYIEQVPEARQNVLVVSLLKRLPSNPYLGVPFGIAFHCWEHRSGYCFHIDSNPYAEPLVEESAFR